MKPTAKAFWLRSPGQGEIREETLAEPGENEVLVRALYSGVSRGTETLVFRGQVPENQHATMRAPFQEGEFPAPVKYGYLSVGRVEEGPDALVGRTVFCLYPHQSRYVVPVSAVTVVPESVPAARAVLAGTVETAVNALWDAAPSSGTGSPSWAAAWSAARSPRCSPATRACGSSSSTPTRRAPRSPARSASTSRCPGTRWASATLSCTPARTKPGSYAPWNSSPPRARSSN